MDRDGLVEYMIGRLNPGRHLIARTMSDYIRQRMGRCPKCGTLVKGPGLPVVLVVLHTEEECLAAQVLES